MYLSLSPPFQTNPKFQRTFLNKFQKKLNFQYTFILFYTFLYRLVLKIKLNVTILISNNEQADKKKLKKLKDWTTKKMNIHMNYFWS